MRSVTTNLFSLQELGTATQKSRHVEVTMRFALARWRDIKELPQAYDYLPDTNLMHKISLFT
jgi:hypothetical protein